MHTPMIVILGAGNMGKSLVGGLIKHGHPANRLTVTDVSEEKLAELNKAYGVSTETDNLAAIKKADVIIFAVKPQLFASIATPLKPITSQTKPLIISIAAGIRIRDMETWLGMIPIVRAMPNTPALLGVGATGFFANALVDAHHIELTSSILKSVGIAVELKSERDLDTVTALSGSGPAYFFLLMEALIDAGVALGLTNEVATQLTLQTAYGAANMALEQSAPVSELRSHVTSKGGTTEKAVSVLEQRDLRNIVMAAIKAAKERSEELSTGGTP